MATFTADTGSGLRGRRGLGAESFDPDSRLVDQARQLKQKASEISDNIDPIDPPEDEIKEARQYINTIKSLLDALAGARQTLVDLIRGPYPQDVKDTIRGIIGSIDSLSPRLSDEIERARAFINRNSDDRRIGDDPNVGRPPRPIRNR